MSSISWLHISDLHLRNKDDYNSSIVRDAFISDIQKFCSDNSLHLDLIFMTGDIAFSGQPEEYKLASQFFDQLLAMTQTPKECFFVIPGNHDVSRKDISFLNSNISSLLNNRDQVNQLLYSRDISSVNQRLNNYTQFLRDYFGDRVISTAIKAEPHYFTRILKLAGKSIAVLGLNSAWLSSGDNDRHNLLVSERQVRDVLRKSKEQKVDYTIALMHHPFDWLKDFDADDTRALLMIDCHFILRGHLHQSNIELVSSPDGRAMLIAAGALYETREYPNAYNIVHFDPENGEGTIYLRRYSDSSGGFFAKDTGTYRNVPDGQYNFLIRANTNIPYDQSSAKQNQNLNNLQDSQLENRADVQSGLTPTPDKGSEEKGEDNQTSHHPLGQHPQSIITARLQKLTGKERQEITNALLEAYPNQESLEIMLDVELNKNLNALVTGNDLEAITFNLVKRAQREGWLNDLIIAAHRRTSGNEMLQQSYKKYILGQIAQMPVQGSSSGGRSPILQIPQIQTTYPLSKTEPSIIDRNKLLALLSNCPSGVFSAIVSDFQVPAEMFSKGISSQAERAAILIERAEQSDDRSLSALYIVYFRETLAKIRTEYFESGELTYKDQCDSAIEVVKHLNELVQIFLKHDDTYSYSYTVPLNNIANQGSDLKASLDAFRNLCPPPPQNAAVRDYYLKRDAIYNKMQSLVATLDVLLSKFK